MTYMMLCNETGQNTAVHLGNTEKSYNFAHVIFNSTKIMSIIRVLFCIIFPPLAVYDKGCGSILITFILTCCGWVPGVIAALVINNK